MLSSTHFLPLSLVGGAVAAAFVTLGGCSETPPKAKAKSGAGASASQNASNGLDLIDPADDVMASGAKQGTGAATGSQLLAGAAATSSRGRWAVMLQTFSQPDHAQRAGAFRVELVRQYPELAGATVRRVGKGSALVIGGFPAADDKAAQAELKRVKAIERNGQKPFAGAMLVRTATDDAPAAIKPNDLRNLRAKFPRVRPLFTLQVAAWSTFGEKGADYAPMRLAAERYCGELRAKGEEAWFHHDEDKETSIVTVGGFDRRAYDAQSTLFSPEVEDLMRKYPAHLLNGEPLLIPVDPRNPKGRTKPQPCRLVEVPET
jgi:hypothetical protein